jgi:hypothetical protein
VCLTACPVPAAGDHRQGEDKRRGTTRSPLVPGRAHTGRPRTCPCDGSARDITEEPSHTHAQKGGKNIISSGR